MRRASDTASVAQLVEQSLRKGEVGSSNLPVGSMNIEPIPAKAAWELEYSNPALLTKGAEPTAEFKRFVDWLTKDQGIDLEQARVLDLGCGTGRNLIYLYKRFGTVGVGVDISDTALQVAHERAPQLQWVQGDLEAGLPGDVAGFDLVIDSTTTHVLNEKKRAALVGQLAEKISAGGWLYVRTLTKDGDRNAHNLIKHMPGPDSDSYVHPNLGIVEHVPSEKDLAQLYEQDFEMLYQKKYTGYQKWGAQSYKRRYVTMYLRRK